MDWKSGMYARLPNGERGRLVYKVADEPPTWTYDSPAGCGNVREDELRPEGDRRD
jgi:hypothetical protein